VAGSPFKIIIVIRSIHSSENPFYVIRIVYIFSKP
jgi:hypothetical protein